MTFFQPDNEKILDAVMEVDAPGLEREEGLILVENWIEKFGEADSKFRVRAVELGFILYVDSLTAVIGVQDAIMEDSEGLFGNEWKSAKEPKRYNGRDSWWWNEDVWTRDISNGAQVQIYALALNRGVFYEADRTGVPISFAVSNPRIRVRAAVKSSPPRFWPTSGSGVYRFHDSTLDGIEEGLRAKAEQVRASRRANLVPWQLTGKQCFPFGNVCQFYDLCKNHRHPIGMTPGEKLKAAFDMSDPAAQLALPYIPDSLIQNPDFVVLSASQYTLHSDCAEKYRIINSHLGSKEAKGSLAEGSVMHAGLAEFYRQVRDFQKEST